MNIDIEAAFADLVAKAFDKGQHPIADTGEYNFTKEKAIRDIATRVLAYAESGPTFDPDGKYQCGSCALRSEPSACTHVSGTISMDIGSCFIWIIGDQINQQSGQKLTQVEAMYSERPKAKGFGCSRCKWSAEAKKPDPDDRPSWCGWLGMHIVPLACCLFESGPDMVEAPGE